MITYTLLAKVLPIVVSPYNTVVTTFFRKGQLIGRYGSSGPSKSTNTSSVVLTWDRAWLKVACLRVKLCMRETRPLVMALGTSGCVSAFSRSMGSYGLEDRLVSSTSWRLVLLAGAGQNSGGDGCEVEGIGQKECGVYCRNAIYLPQR